VKEKFPKALKGAILLGSYKSSEIHGQAKSSKAHRRMGVRGSMARTQEGSEDWLFSLSQAAAE
jgi:hypothetical protein